MGSKNEGDERGDMKMKIATILYSYVRNEHTEKVLSALKENTVLPEKLFVFQDGLKNSKDKEAWKKQMH